MTEEDLSTLISDEKLKEEKTPPSVDAANLDAANLDKRPPHTLKF